MFIVYRGIEDMMFFFECYFLFVLGNFIDVYVVGGGFEGFFSVR